MYLRSDCWAHLKGHAGSNYECDAIGALVTVSTARMTEFCSHDLFTKNKL